VSHCPPVGPHSVPTISSSSQSIFGLISPNPLRILNAHCRHKKQRWYDQPARLTETAYSAINALGNDVFLRVVNGWEIQIKAQLGTLTLAKPRRVILHEEQVTNGFKLLPVT
jgi:PIN domain nuclease of toxin-antitoxin system